MTTKKNCAKDLEQMLALGAGEPGSSQTPMCAQSTRPEMRPGRLSYDGGVKASHDVTTAERKRHRKW